MYWHYNKPTMADINEIRTAQSELLNELYKQITKTFSYQLQYGIVFLAKKGVSSYQMAEAFGLTPARIYQIIDRFEKDGVEFPKEEQISEEEKNG